MNRISAENPPFSAANAGGRFPGSVRLNSHRCVERSLGAIDNDVARWVKRQGVRLRGGGILCKHREKCWPRGSNADRGGEWTRGPAEARREPSLFLRLQPASHCPPRPPPGTEPHFAPARFGPHWCQPASVKTMTRPHPNGPATLCLPDAPVQPRLLGRQSAIMTALPSRARSMPLPFKLPAETTLDLV